ncbi:MAG: DUF72 domain-containing protein [Candidatus Methanomethyliaceae archaeon]|nr:DUF72 domain-containing protein [Candidatus Methanomethyliaceae archaeon]
MEVKVGTCGWSVRGGRSAYYKTFCCIELQDTFYRLPKVETAQRQRDEAPNGFEFVVKAWQALTHPFTSPTWRRAGGLPKWGKVENFGFLRPTEENFRAWAETLKVCEVLRVRFVVVQTPPAFKPSPETIEGMRVFFNSVERRGIGIGWEPRGEWNQRPDDVRALCRELSLIHVVDPFRRMPFLESDILYFRLHGIGGGETNYSYTYTDEDLRRLLQILKEIKGAERVYIMFNNLNMAQDAQRFLKILGGG